MSATAPSPKSPNSLTATKAPSAAKSGGTELRGERSGTHYTLGQPLRVQVARVDLDGRRIDFCLPTASAALQSGRKPKAAQAAQTPQTPQTSRPRKTRSNTRPNPRKANKTVR